MRINRYKKIGYSVNSFNQLVVKLPLEPQPKVLKGEFKTGRNNSLVYIINEPDKCQRQYGIPNRVEFEGKWQLSPEHNLVLNLKDDEGFNKERLVIKGELFSSEGDSLTFKIKSKVSLSVTRISFLKLRGRWKADRFNRITFDISKKENPDILTFKGAWEMNKKQEVVYKYRKLKTRAEKILVFKGYWDVLVRNKLRYVLRGKNKSRFDFKVYWGTKNIYPQEGKIKYRIGIGAGRLREENIKALYGDWKFGRKTGLSFEMKYGKRTRKVKFSTEVKMKDKRKVIVSLLGRRGSPLGINLIFKKEYLPEKDFNWFLKMKDSGRNKYIGVGGKLRF